MDSPTPTSAKCWIGSAGQSATHAVVYAQLLVNGTNHGLNAFIVPLRDLAKGTLLPGVFAGRLTAPHTHIPASSHTPLPTLFHRRHGRQNGPQLARQWARVVLKRAGATLCSAVAVHYCIT